MRLSLFPWALLCALATPWAAQADDAFWQHWSDGKAELNGYDLWQPRYGELRHGRAVLIYVTEPYSRSRRVKVDRVDPNDPDQLTVLKLNHVRKFQTGVYDYSAMTSVFADPNAGFRPLTVRFSMQEWCGLMDDTVTVEPGRLRQHANSYFDGESGGVTVPGDALPADAVFITARTLAGTVGTAPLPQTLVPDALYRRLRHQPFRPYPAQARWGAPRQVTVPAGDFTVRDFHYARPDGSTCALHVEVAQPHRIIGWACSDGEKAQLRGSTRAPYWQQHGEGDAAQLRAIGLTPMGVAPGGP